MDTNSFGWGAVPTTYLSEQEWLDARPTFLGASESPAILGVGYLDQSAYSVAVSKTQPRKVDRTFNHLRMGQILEPAIRTAFNEITAWKPVSLDPWTVWRNQELPWFGCTLDHACEHPDHGIIPVEFKAVGAWNSREWDDDQTPLQYQVQLQHQMAVVGVQWGALFALNGFEPHLRLIARDNEFLSRRLIPDCIKFWTDLQRGVFPAVDDTEATGTALDERWQKTRMLTIELGDEWVKDDGRYVRIKNLIPRLEKQLTAISNRIKARMGDAEQAVCPNGVHSYTWKATKTGSRQFKRGNRRR